MFRTPIKKLILISILALGCLYISIPSKFSLIGKEFNRPNLDIKIANTTIKRNFDMRFGLDLAGGSHLVFEADTSKIAADKKKTAIEGVRDVIERRVNLFGISEPTVQTSTFEGKDRIVVELPGIKDTNEAITLIGKTAQLIFFEIKDIPATKTSSASAIPVATTLTGADLQSAQVVFDSQNGKPAIALKFTKQGGDKFAEITGKNIGRVLPIVLDGQMISAPRVQAKIVGGDAQITGNFTIEEAKALSVQLNAGALPIPINLVEERTVGATLGAESIQKSIIAGVVGIVIVCIFMVVSYGFLGLVADFGLIIFGLITLALYKLIPVTLTLPGIAGFMLSIGMAVDSNILIFERFKEEKLKRNYSDALEISFGRAWDSIRDANFATIITALILINPLGWTFLPMSGPVRGFGITLLLGIFISLFTGIFVSRNLLRVFVKDGKNKK